MTLQQNFRWLPIGVLASSLLILTACGGGGSSSSGTGTGTTNTAPVVGNVTATAKKDASTAIKLQGTDADGDSLSYSVVKSPTSGKVTISGSTATYTPTSGYSGSDSFTYKANDGKADSGTATVSLTVTTVNSAPVATAVTATAITGIAKKITLSGTDADGDTLTAAISGNPQHGTVTLSGFTATYTATSGYTGTDTFTSTVNDGSATSSAATVTVTVNANTVMQPTPTGKLNDSGVTTCGDYAFTSTGDANGHTNNNNVNCALTTDADGDTVPQGQDAQYGRDVTDNDDSDGHAGFSFTKISSTGQALAASATSWSCVKDNVTGLIWEVKTDDGGLHDRDWEYSWYNSNSTTNGGDAGLQNSGYCNGSNCDTQSFAAAVNNENFCGGNNWRMPTLGELQSLADFSREEPAIDTNYFPTVKPWVYWTATPVAHPYSKSNAWFIGFNGGNDNPINGKSVAHHAMLVRSGN